MKSRSQRIDKPKSTPRFPSTANQERQAIRFASRVPVCTERSREREKKYSKYVEGDFGLSVTVCQNGCLSVHAKTWKIS